MAEGKSWVDMLEKALIPITGLIVTGGLAWSQDAEHKRQACLDSQMSLIQFVCADKDNQCKPTPERAGHVPQVLQLVKSRCGSDFPSALTDIAITATGAAGDADATAKVSAQSGKAPSKPIAVAAAAAPDLAPKSADPAPQRLERGAQPLAPRVYIQIQSDDQRPAAEQFRQAVDHGLLNGMPISSPGVELVTTGKKVGATELRCITKADCALAPNLAAYLGVLLSMDSLPVRDLSARYEGRSGVRPNHFEVWFGPGPIRLSPAVSANARLNVSIQQTITPAGAPQTKNPNLF